MKFKPGDICITDVTFSADCYIIVEAFDTGVDSYLVLSTKQRTILLISSEPLHKIGEVSPAPGVAGVQELLMQKPKPPALDSDDYVRGNLRARRAVLADAPENRPYWTILADAKPGAVLTVHNRTGSELVTFHYVLERGKKYVFVGANEKGKLLQYTLTCLCLGPGSHGTEIKHGSH